MTCVIIILLATIVLFVVGKPRADVVALGALTALLLSGVLTPAEALSGFSSPVLVMMVGLFVVGGAILQTGLAKAAGSKILVLARGNDQLLFLLVVLGTAFIGAFVSNTGTVALMMPIVVSMAAAGRANASRLLMPLAFASSMGGMLTLIGTPPNLVIDEALRASGHEGLSFFSFLPVGLVCLAVGTAVLMPLSARFLNKKPKANGRRKGKQLDELINEYRLAADVRAYRIDARSTIVGSTVGELNLRARYGVTIFEIRHEQRRGHGLMRHVSQRMPLPSTALSAGDTLYLQGAPDDVRRFADEASLKEVRDASFHFYELGVAEIVVMPGSRLVGSMLRDSCFRENYQINVLGIKRGDAYITDELPTARLRAGDTLLIQGLWENITRLDRDETDWVLLGQPQQMADRVTLNNKAPLAGAIMLAMVLAMAIDAIPVAPVTAVIAAAVLMVAAGCFRSVDAAYKTINWQSVMLIGAMMPMATALEKTGISASVSHALVASLGHVGPTALLCGLYFTTSLLTMFISNTATAVLMAPIAMTASTELGVSPMPMLFAVTLGASMCFASPFSTPPNALVMHAGGYTFADYIRVGLPLQIIMGLVMTVVLPLIFPF